jgi:hypothetical protein
MLAGISVHPAGPAPGQTYQYFAGSYSKVQPVSKYRSTLYASHKTLSLQIYKPEREAK